MGIGRFENMIFFLTIPRIVHDVVPPLLFSSLLARGGASCEVSSSEEEEGSLRVDNLRDLDSAFAGLASMSISSSSASASLLLAPLVFCRFRGVSSPASTFIFPLPFPADDSESDVDDDASAIWGAGPPTRWNIASGFASAATLPSRR